MSPKSGRHREVPLNDRVVEALKVHRHLRGEFVFCRDDGAPLTQQICRRALMRACRVAGLRHIQWHALRLCRYRHKRHSFASHLVMRRVPMKSVQELMGHATMTMTLRYSHLTPDVRRDAVNALLAADSERHEDGTSGSRREKAVRR